jgi:hypothetical protein
MKNLILTLVAYFFIVSFAFANAEKTNSKDYTIDSCICESNATDGLTKLENIFLASNLASIDCSIKSITVQDTSDALNIRFEKSVSGDEGTKSKSVYVSSGLFLSKENKVVTPFENSVFSVTDYRFMEKNDGYFFQYSHIDPNSFGTDYYYSILWVDKSNGKWL